MDFEVKTTKRSSRLFVNK